MLKYLNTAVTFQEIPDEITLCINITGCRQMCKNCHSPYLAEDIGKPLGESELLHLIESNKGVTCLCLMGGDSNPNLVDNMMGYIKVNFPELKTAWYSGKQKLAKEIDLANFDYIKLGPYKEELGPLTSRTTNQVMLKVDHVAEKDFLVDITSKFWK